MKRFLFTLTALLLAIIMQAHSANITPIAAPEVLAIPIEESNDPFIDLTKQNVIAYGPSPEVPNNTDYTKMRKQVYDRLVEAQALLPKGLKLCIYEAYRSLTLQQTLFENRHNKLKAKHPTWTEAELFHETIKMVSPITNLDGSKNIPAHATGGAIDVYLIDTEGRAVPMGIHPKKWMEDTEGRLSASDSQAISKEARYYRNLMHHALSKAGFINYPTEYWHWSYGDKYWAFGSRQSPALYGTVESMQMVSF